MGKELLVLTVSSFNAERASYLAGTLGTLAESTQVAARDKADPRALGSQHNVNFCVVVVIVFGSCA